MTVPNYVEKLPASIKARWVALFESVAKKEGDAIALIAANKWLKRQIKKTSVEGKTDKAFFIEKISFDLSDTQLIKNTDDGEEYVEFILTDDKMIKNGDIYPTALLKKWVSQVNSQTFVGDIDHEEYNSIVSNTETVEQAASIIKSAKRGIAKTVKAIFDKGKMWVKAMIDKRYSKLIKSAKGVSLEAIVTRDADGKIVDGDLLGFTFAVNREPVNPRAVIA